MAQFVLHMHAICIIKAYTIVFVCWHLTAAGPECAAQRLATVSIQRSRCILSPLPHDSRDSTCCVRLVLHSAVYLICAHIFVYSLISYDFIDADETKLFCRVASAVCT